MLNKILLKNLRQISIIKNFNNKNNLNNFQSFSFARKISNNFPSLNNDETKAAKKESSIDHLPNKNINIIKEDVSVTIKPYFPNAVSEKEKSFTHIDSSKMSEGRKVKKEDQAGINSLEILKNKRIDKKKIAASRKASLFMQNIKRELPEDL